MIYNVVGKSAKCVRLPLLFALSVGGFEKHIASPAIKLLRDEVPWLRDFPFGKPLEECFLFWVERVGAAQ